MSSRNVRFVALVAAALLAGRSAPAELKPGDRMPALDAAWFAGTLPTMTGRVVLLDFWASWCAPCKASFPHLDQLYRDYARQDLVVLGVSVDEESSDMRKFLESTPVSFPTVRDREQRLVALADVPTMPTSFLIDRKGRVRMRHAGFQGEQTVQDLRAEIEALLHEK